MKTECFPEDTAKHPRALALAPFEPGLLNLHEALDIDEFWQAATKALRSALPFHNMSMSLSPSKDAPGSFRVSFPVADPKLYAAKIEAMVPVYAILARHPKARVLRLSDEVSIGSLIGTPFYKNFMAPEGWRYCASMIFRADGRLLGRLCLNRRAEQGDFTDGEMTLLKDLHVQFHVAARRVCRFERERETNTILTQNGHDDPATLLLDERYAPVFHNRAAVRICTLWRLGADHARVLKPEFGLPEEIRLACQGLFTKWQRRPRKGRLAETEATRTVKHAGGLSANVQLVNVVLSTRVRIHFLVHLSCNGTREPDLSVLALLHRLTATEQAVANLVAWGLDNQHVATELRISVNTVRVHLHNIFHKLEVDSRGRLAVLLRLAVL
ncbi:MAG: helix-turn-helix transcriptional regulator [Terrimicrobiaceae bacterium]